jgi:regulator of replication initiation timing
MSSSLEQELDRIAERVATLARLAMSLREENQALRIAVDQRDGENKLLRDRLDTARERVETLIARMPADS